MWTRKQKAYRESMKFIRMLESKTNVIEENDYFKVIEYYIPQMVNGNWISKRQTVCLHYGPSAYNAPKKKESE